MKNVELDARTLDEIDRALGVIAAIGVDLQVWAAEKPRGRGIVRRQMLRLDEQMAKIDAALGLGDDYKGADYE